MTVPWTLLLLVVALLSIAGDAHAAPACVPGEIAAAETCVPVPHAAARIDAIVRAGMAKHRLKAVLAGVSVGDRPLLLEAWGGR